MAEQNDGSQPGKIALMFPGQGSQHVGMGAELARAFPVARETFEEAGDVLGFDLATVCFEGPSELLGTTDVCQPAVLTTSVAAWRVAQAEGLRGDLTLGHSLGEYAALVASGTLEFREALRIVRARGAATTDVARAVPGQMAALLGITDEEAESLCAEAGDVWPANYNSPGQIVASGLHRGVERLLDLARSRGITVRLLDVDGAFHSSVMAPAAERLRDVLAGARVHAPSLPFVSATTARVEAGAERVRQILTQQLTGPVRFTHAVREAMDMGTDAFVEFGPRRVLVGLVRRIRPDVRVLHVGTPADLPGVRALIGRV
ncbi:MAG TPA: ACP S-malonyltransferase [Miltoncostaeaceae bacterium]|nr:ACP S-malonyltransferase [Miltoncostaeaceae bacterium]